MVYNTRNLILGLGLLMPSLGMAESTSLIPLPVEQLGENMRVGISSAAVRGSTDCERLKKAKVQLTSGYKIKIVINPKMVPANANKDDFLFTLTRNGEKDSEENPVSCKIYINLAVSRSTTLSFKRVTPEGRAFLSEGHTANFQAAFGYKLGPDGIERLGINRGVTVPGVKGGPGPTGEPLGKKSKIGFTNMDFDFEDPGSITMILSFRASITGRPKEKDAKSQIFMLSLDAKSKYTAILSGDLTVDVLEP